MLNNKICILGASGFVGAGVFEYLNYKGYEILGLGTNPDPWRLEKLKLNYKSINNESSIQELDKFKPGILINFVANGGYSFQQNSQKIIDSNFKFVEGIATWATLNNSFLIHAGTSSEYGKNSAAPKEDANPEPNSLYAITKLAATHLLKHLSNSGLKSVVLRLYSVYGPKEDSSRLMPAVVRGIISQDWPQFTDFRIGRDFIYIDDVNRLIEKILIKNLEAPNSNFEIFNVGSGNLTTMGDLVKILEEKFNMPKVIDTKFEPRNWDIFEWYANIEKVKKHFDWSPEIDVISGLKLMEKWYVQSDNIKYLGTEYSAQKINNDKTKN